MLRRSLAILVVYFGGVSVVWAAGSLRIDSITPPSEATTPGATVTVQGDGFAPGAQVYFDGLAARQTLFIDSTRLEVITPYLRPGQHDVYVELAGNVVKAAKTFTALPTGIDSKIDAAMTQAELGQVSAALRLLDEVIATTDDNQVRAFAHYQKGQLYYAQRDWNGWHVESALIYDNRHLAGRAVQTYWPYRLANAHTVYFHSMQPPNDPCCVDDFTSYSDTIRFDVTQNPEPHFYRGLLYARCGKLSEARADSHFCLKADPKNASYAALAAFIAAQAGDKQAAGLSTKARALLALAETASEEARALALLGETAYVLGDTASAEQDWKEAAEAHQPLADIAFMEGKKHLHRGEQRIAAMLLSECVTMDPGSPMANEAQKLLTGIPAARLHPPQRIKIPSPNPEVRLSARKRQK